jgi:hypothetical protein
MMMDSTVKVALVVDLNSAEMVIRLTGVIQIQI